jgi:sugar-specific transcriptional regulator TrmB
MTIDEIKNSFNNSVDTWKAAAENYSEQLFAQKPAEDAWSIGQVCEHLTASTKRAFVVIDKCLSGNANENEQKTEAGERAISSNVLSPVKVTVPSHKETPPAQPENKQAVKDALEEVRKNFMIVAEKIKSSKATGKEKHPVLGFMNAHEWLHTIDMHLRHHLKQKEGIDAFLKGLRA